MAVPILPILGALSSVASTAWDTYTKIKRARETVTGLKDKDALSNCVERLEDACLEQAQMLSELSKDLEQFAQAMQAEIEEVQKRQRHLKWIACVSAFMAAASAAVALFVLLK